MEQLPIIRPNSNSLTIRESASIPSEHEMMVYHTMAEQAVTSKMYRGMGEKAGVMMIMLAARELGIPPMQALNGGLNIISGKVELSARMMNALIRKAGHKITITNSTDSTCTLQGRRVDNHDTASVTYTVEEAKQAGLIKAGGGWTKCPKDMCFARALSRLARQLFSDVIGIGYVEGEISQGGEIKASEYKSKDYSQVVETESLEDQNQKEITYEDEIKKWTDTYMGIFDVEDQPLAEQYLSVVMMHFKWDTVTAIQEMLKDIKKLMERFQAYKQKVNTVPA